MYDSNLKAGALCLPAAPRSAYRRTIEKRAGLRREARETSVPICFAAGCMAGGLRNEI